MKDRTLIRTDIIVCTIIIIGFIITSVVSYKANAGFLLEDAEKVASISSDAIYHEISALFDEPVKTARFMANDQRLKDMLANEPLGNEDTREYEHELNQYLNAYREQYGYDTVFAVSNATNRYYHFTGLNRALSRTDETTAWFYDFVDIGNTYEVRIDTNTRDDNCVTVFVNYRIFGKNGNTLGIVGVGVKVDSLQDILSSYKPIYNINALLMTKSGEVQIHDGLGNMPLGNLLDNAGYAEVRTDLFDTVETNQCISVEHDGSNYYVISRYIKPLDWYLVMQSDISALVENLHSQMYIGIGIVTLVIILVLVVITGVMWRYNRQITNLTVAQEFEYSRMLQEATTALYESILEFNITTQRGNGDATLKYFQELGLNADTPYAEALKKIAEKRVKEEYLEKYLETFSPTNVLACYNNGITNLLFDCQFLCSDGNYRWLRITGRIFYWQSDHSVRMISYREDIDDQKRREMFLIEQSERDALTMLYNTAATRRHVETLLREVHEGKHVMLIIDIDDFKLINDNYGHSVGDRVIVEFASELRASFRDSDIIGRIGGDEFLVLMRNYPSVSFIRSKLNAVCGHMSSKVFNQVDRSITTSIGVALYPEHGATYDELFEKADEMLYQVKESGKGIYRIYDET